MRLKKVGSTTERALAGEPTNLKHTESKEVCFTEERKVYDTRNANIKSLIPPQASTEDRRSIQGWEPGLETTLCLYSLVDPKTQPYILE